MPIGSAEERNCRKPPRLRRDEQRSITEAGPRLTARRLLSRTAFDGKILLGKPMIKVCDQQLRRRGEGRTVIFGRVSAATLIGAAAGPSYYGQCEQQCAGSSRVAEVARQQLPRVPATIWWEKSCETKAFEEIAELRLVNIRSARPRCIADPLVGFPDAAAIGVRNKC